MSEDIERLWIQLTDCHVLSADNFNWIVIHAKPSINKKTGEPTTTEKKTFHPTIVSAAKTIIDQCTKDSEIETIQELINFQSELSDRLVNSLAEYDAQAEE